MKDDLNLNINRIEGQVREIVNDLIASFPLTERHILVIGTSTSEVIGEKIGTAGSHDVAKMIYQVLHEFQSCYHFHLAFQCCEHLNRALVVERKTVEQFHLDEVTVVPVPTAGGSMAAYAFNHMVQPVVVEAIKADAGIDIGDTFIGMHLKPVAVPIRPRVKQIGNAHVTMAMTRPKLIGGARAVYEKTKENTSCM